MRDRQIVGNPLKLKLPPAGRNAPRRTSAKVDKIATAPIITNCGLRGEGMVKTLKMLQWATRSQVFRGKFNIMLDLSQECSSTTKCRSGDYSLKYSLVPHESVIVAHDSFKCYRNHNDC